MTLLVPLQYEPKGIALEVISSNGTTPLDPADPLMQEGGALIQANFIKIANDWPPRNIIFGINGSFVETLTPLTNPVQIIKNGTIASGVGIVLTNPTVAPTVFKVCKGVTAYSSGSVVATFSVAINGTVTATIVSPSLLAGDYLTIYCTSVGTITGADGNFTLTIN